MLAQEYLGLSPATPNLENTLPDARTVADRRFDNLTADGSYMPVTGSIFYTGKAAVENVAVMSVCGYNYNNKKMPRK